MEPNIPGTEMSIIGIRQNDGRMKSVDIEGSYKGYCIRAYDPDQADSLVPQDYEEDSLVIPCPLFDRQLFKTNSAIPYLSLEQEAPEICRILTHLDKYHGLNRNVNQDREAKVKLLLQLRTEVANYLGQHEFDGTETVQKTMLVEMQAQINQEFWAIFGLARQDCGKIYMPEDEMAGGIDNFASGNSASIDKVIYSPGIVTVFKGSSQDQKITALVAKEFGIHGDNSESANLPHRSVMFCELDALLAIHLTPQTWYAIHNEMPGTCQQFVTGSHISERKFVDVEYDSKHLIVAEVVSGDLKDQGWGFRLESDSGVDPNSLKNMSEPELQRLYWDKKLVLTRETLVDIAPIDLSHPVTQKAMADAQLLDHLGGSIDRNQSNIIFVKENNPISPGQGYYVPRLIDNDLSFAAEMVHDNPEIELGQSPFLINMAGSVPKQIDKATAERFLQVSFEQVKELIKLHQVTGDAEIASQRERFSHLRKAIQDAKAGRPSPVTIVSEWNERTFADALQNHESYVAKTHNCRVGDLMELMDIDPDKAAQRWAEQFHLIGGQSLAMAMKRQHPGKIEHALALYSDKVVVRDSSDIVRAGVFIATLLDNHAKRFDQSEKQFYAAKFINLMLGEAVSNDCIGKALAVCHEHGLLSISVMDALMTKAIQNAKGAGNLQQWKPSRAFSKQMPFMTQSVSHPGLEVKVAFSDCFERVKTNMPVRSMLRFWGLLQVYTLPFLREQNGYDLVDSRELTHAMQFVTPDFIKEVKKKPEKDMGKFIREQCFAPPVDKLSAEKIDQVVDTLVYHFDVADKLPVAGFAFPGKG